MNLYEYENAYRDFFNAVDAGEIPEEAIADTLESIVGDIDGKIDNVACYIKSAYAEVDAIKAEARSLMERAKSKERAADRLKEYLAERLPAFGYDKKFESTRNKLSFRSSKAVVVDDDFSFANWAMHHAEDLITFKTPEPNKKAIKDAIAEGREVVGARIEERKSLIIK